MNQSIVIKDLGEAKRSDRISGGLSELRGVEVRADGLLALGDDVDVFNDNDPVTCLAIGYTAMGDLIVMSLWPENLGAIAYKQAWREGFYFLADNIAEFFELLHDREHN